MHSKNVYIVGQGIYGRRHRVWNGSASAIFNVYMSLSI